MRAKLFQAVVKTSIFIAVELFAFKGEGRILSYCLLELPFKRLIGVLVAGWLCE